MKALIFILLLMPSYIFAQKLSLEKENESFDKFQSLRIEFSGGASNLKYQDKDGGSIESTDSKKFFSMNFRWMYHTSSSARWYLGLNLEDAEYKDLPAVNSMAFNPQVGLIFNPLEKLSTAIELSAYQHLEMNQAGLIVRKTDPALRFDWKYDAVSWANNRFGFGQNYLLTFPIPINKESGSDTNKYADLEVNSQIHYKKLFKENALEISLQHSFRQYESQYYKMELNNFLIGTRFSFSF